MNTTSTKLIIPVLLACVLAIGCNNAKKTATASVMPPRSAVLDVPATPPAQQFTPPQPLVYDPPQDKAGESSAVADASDSYAAPTERTPTKRISTAKARTASASVSGAKYTVRKGDSMWSIAVSKYGNGNKWKQIAAANPKIDPNRIHAGQTITLP